jgi:hypothetical protein
MIDYGPLVFRSLSGRALDPSSVQVPGGCIGLFTEDDHRLVGATETDQSGNYTFPAVTPGKYRLVVSCDGLCVANVPLRIVRWPRGGLYRKLILHMGAGAIDSCSYGSYR